jgi:hypothetical protein
MMLLKDKFLKIHAKSENTRRKTAIKKDLTRKATLVMKLVMGSKE